MEIKINLTEQAITYVTLAKEMTKKPKADPIQLLNQIKEEKLKKSANTASL